MPRTRMLRHGIISPQGAPLLLPRLQRGDISGAICGGAPFHYDSPTVGAPVASRFAWRYAFSGQEGAANIEFKAIHGS